MENMKLAQKLQRLLKDKKPTEVAAQIGVTPAAIGKYLQGSTPAADVGIFLASYLGVDPMWLFSDALDWPPETAIDRMDNCRLIDELIRRRNDIRDRLGKALDQAENLPWIDYAKKLNVDREAWAEPGGMRYEANDSELGRVMQLAFALQVFLMGSEAKILRTAEGKDRLDFEERIHRMIGSLTSTSGGKWAMIQNTIGHAFNGSHVLGLIEEALDAVLKIQKTSKK